MQKKILFFCFVLFLQTAFAIETPHDLPRDKRIKSVVFEENNVVPIHATTFVATQIEFSKDEYIINIQNGDLSAWTASVQKDLPNMVFIKPTIFGSSTNMTVVTNTHTYYFELSSNKQPIKNITEQTYAVKFIYPEEEQAKLQQELSTARTQHDLAVTLKPKKYNWDYSFSGERNIIPTHIFDDGNFTYMQFSNQIPAIFAVDNLAGEETVVNFRKRNDYIVILRTSPQFTLRAGNAVASIFNNNAINSKDARI